MNLQERINLLGRLGKHMLSDDESWQQAKQLAGIRNSWFIPEFVDLAVKNMARHFLDPNLLLQWAQTYELPLINSKEKKIGIAMAGNIPLVGFHDFLCVFLTGHAAAIKPSSKDEVLIRHIVGKLCEWQTGSGSFLLFADMLKGCDAYIATGSNISAGYFDYYFSRYPHIIRRNRTSVAILSGKESSEELVRLADDVFQFFGLGCRNVTKLYVPMDYDFNPMLTTFKKYNYLADHHKYKSNYDYNLAINLLNKNEFMSTESLLLVENPSFFSPISQLNFEKYEHAENLRASLSGNEEIQCIVSESSVEFGKAQSPSLCDYADGVDTIRFLTNL